MSTLLQQNRGALFVADGVGAPARFSGGIPYGPAGAVAIDTVGVVDHFHQGLPLTAEGRIAASALDPVRFNSGSMPLDAAGRLGMFIDDVTSLYVNPEFAGGGVDTPPTSHTIPFNSNGFDTEPDLARPGFFKCLSNTQDINGRSALQINLKNTNPALIVGNSYRIGYTVRNLSPNNYGSVLNTQSSTSITFLSNNRRSFPNGLDNVFYEFTIDAADWELNIRVGCGTTANNIWRGEIYNPTLVDITNSGAAVAWNGGLGYTDTGALTGITL